MKVQHIGLLFVLFFMVFVLINTGIAKAQTENKFGIIDVQKVLRMSIAAREIRPQLEKMKNVFRKKIDLLFLPFLIVFVLINTSVAKAKTENKFGIIDVQKVLRMSIAAREIRPQLEKMKNVFRKKIDISKKELRKTKMKLETEKGVLSPEAYAKKRKHFKRQVTVIQRRVHTLNRALDRALANAMGKIHKTI
ncbi:MAG: OmpH family outer membrane protein, partial [Pseudomonadota bacterium]|nr:OmpH family outer membrane protein [Pseudomonadota bacterium]